MALGLISRGHRGQGLPNLLYCKRGVVKGLCGCVLIIQMRQLSDSAVLASDYRIGTICAWWRWGEESPQKQVCMTLWGSCKASPIPERGNGGGSGTHAPLGKGPYVGRVSRLTYGGVVLPLNAAK